MKVYSFGAENAPVILLLPGTCCHWKGNFGRVIPLLSDRYRVLCVSYDGFDETEHTEFPTMLEETEKIESYIQEHCGGHIRASYVSLAQLAAEHAISVSHLQKLFKQTYGMPVYHYIKEYRLEQAAVELVRSRKPITEIAQHAGYDNASKFSESFKKRYGKTPSRYRADKTNAVKRSIETKTE